MKILQARGVQNIIPTAYLTLVVRWSAPRSRFQDFDSPSGVVQFVSRLKASSGERALWVAPFSAGQL